MFVMVLQKGCSCVVSWGNFLKMSKQVIHHPLLTAAQSIQYRLTHIHRVLATL
jgi:hypothetical protein